MPEAPRWRVVIPLARPVAAKRWRDVWQRARAALCPEADPSCKDPSRGEAYMEGVIHNLETATRPGRNNALNGAAWTLGRWIAAGALEQGEVEDALYVAALANGLVADDGERQCWATIRSGLGAGLQEPIALDKRRTPAA